MIPSSLKLDSFSHREVALAMNFVSPGGFPEPRREELLAVLPSRLRFFQRSCSTPVGASLRVQSAVINCICRME